MRVDNGLARGLTMFCMCSASAPARAMIIDASEPPGAIFGDLNQNLTDCPSLGCGPAAAVNSFVFLQNEYPAVYKNPLVPRTNPALVGQVAVANALLGSGFMNCNCNNGGTIWENFILGKENWIEAVDPGRTRYLAQSFFGWDAATFGAKPGNVTDHAAPSIDFLASEINHGEDVEVLINVNGSGHYLTLTGLTWDTDSRTGTLRYIDSLDGQPHSGDLSALTDGIALTYTSPDALILLQRVGITVAISESPKSIPEPPTSWIALAAMVVAMARRRTASIPGRGILEIGRWWRSTGRGFFGFKTHAANTPPNPASRMSQGGGAYPLRPPVPYPSLSSRQALSQAWAEGPSCM